jgi:ribosomal protein S12 methylthiotransferase
MLGEAGQAGHEVVDAPEKADVIVVNTCGFIEAAKEESIDTILEMTQYKTGGACEQLIVTGCLTQRYPDQVAKEIPEIDHILGSADYDKIRSVLDGAQGRRKGLPVIQVSETPKYLYDHDTPRVLTGATYSAYIKIAEGCDRPCAFCIIPKLRGPQRSRSIASVVAEAEQLAAQGTVEVNLIAQDLTRYGYELPDKPTLAMLLSELAEVKGLRWIRLHYTYPTAFSDELIDVIATRPAIVPYVDVPLQHIDDDMLKRMRRGHTSKVTHKLIERLRSSIDDLVLRTTFIVGHPGETDEAFRKLCDFVTETEFDRFGAFTYSREEGTVSAMLPHRVEQDVAEARCAELMEIQRGISARKLSTMVGKELEVLVEGVSDESEYLLQGRFYGQAPEIDGAVYLSDAAAEVGDMVRATVTTTADYDLAASMIEEPAQAIAE